MRADHLERLASLLHGFHTLPTPSEHVSPLRCLGDLEKLEQELEALTQLSDQVPTHARRRFDVFTSDCWFHPWTADSHCLTRMYLVLTLCGQIREKISATTPEAIREAVALEVCAMFNGRGGGGGSLGPSRRAGGLAAVDSMGASCVMWCRTRAP